MPIENPPTDYPKMYSLTGLAFSPTEYFEYQADEYVQVYPESGILQNVDSIILNEFYAPNSGYFNYFQEIELLSDSLARIQLGEEGAMFYVDTTLSYQLTDDKIKLFFGVPDNQAIELGWSAAEEQIFHCVQAYSYNYYNTALNSRDYRGLAVNDCFADTQLGILDSIILQENAVGYLQYEDTIILNVSRVNLDLVE